jgi:PAS domain S-box-containing protein
MLTYLQDQNGVPLTTVQVMKTVSTRTTAPIFSFYDTIFGLGIVGGKLTSAEAYGDAIAETAKKMFREGQSLPAVETVAQARDIYDWRQIEKWRIPANRFPAGSDIRNRKISFWQQHLHKIILVSAVILLQTLLILALSINMIRRKRVETALSAAEKKYLDHLEEQVKERTEEIEQTNKKLLLEIGERTRTEKALVISENMYRVLVESANSIILRWTSKGEITFINQFAQQFFGFNLDEIIGQNIIGTIVPEVETSGRRISGLVEDIVKNPAAYEGNVNENVKKNGQRVWVAWTNRPLTDENSQLVEILSIGTDITKLVEAEKELRDTMEELDRAKERAESADRLKSAFLATMSHELRTPLNSIIGFTGILIQRLGGPLNDEQDKQLNMVYNSARHLLDLINDVLDISKIEAEQLKVVSEPFNLRNSVEKIIKSSQPLADKKGIDLSVSIAPEIVEINSDCRRFEQIMLNLISNAIKFTEQGFVHVNCKTKDDKVIIEVKDSGIGIKKEDMGILFNAFQQIETGITRKYDGTGLGLSICKKLAHLLGGEIIVESEWGAGSTFSLILPKG